VGIHVDIGAGGRAPTADFAAAAGRPGFWNAVAASAFDVPLLGEDGAPSGARISRCGGGGSFAFDGPGTTGDVGRLLDDHHDARTTTWTIAGLPGDTVWDVYAYSFQARDPAGSESVVTVSGGAAGAQVCGRAAWAGTWIEGGHYVRDRVAVVDGRPLTIFVGPSAADTPASLNGLQLLPVTEVGTAACFGAGCPCGNDDPAAGCASSTGRGGSLQGSGSASAADDDLVLRAVGLPPGGTALLVMGDATGTVPLFDGLRCVQGSPHRFDASIQTTGAAGTASFGPGLAAASGGLVVPGSTWHFQALFEDPSGSPCGTGRNLSSLLSVPFAP
jgi:hypothetical protein